MKREMEVCVLSDIELGVPGSNPLELLNYLKGIQPNLLILSGSVVNNRQFGKRYFSRKTLMIIQQIMQMALQGCKVVVITGSGSTELKRFAGVNLGNIHLREEMTFKLQGKEYLIFNAPEKRKRKKWLNFIQKLFSIFRRDSDLYESSTRENSSENFYSLSLKKAFEKKSDAMIVQQNNSGGISTVDFKGRKIEIYHPGNWFENLSSLEYSKGIWELYQFNELDFGLRNPKLEVKDSDKNVPDEVVLIREPLQFRV
nr:hypothetical protein [Saprospiraceae bacterium]